jgi:hypothetical protein
MRWRSRRSADDSPSRNMSRLAAAAFADIFFTVDEILG